ncbi:oxidoreductase [Actinomadura montaniterrae]|uniref:FAD-binding protein n=1 Tax=Actinomadura montaniterrae TaxID=1803903 RepID=A0A6L3W151_9ACTN|nr:FAD-dependent oxidoreductase [Actinomadura montaniterrae]KAB2388206.1 FAD-binding protein [Actinomadura montaniterrae]
MAFDSLFQPVTIGTLKIRNRIVKSPNTTGTCNPDGTVTQRTIDHYRTLGEGGAGLVMVEYTYVDDDAAKSIHGQPGAANQEHVAGLGWLADEIRAGGARAGLQLVHSGRQRFLGTAPMKSASDSSWDVAEMPFGVRPAPMTTEEIAGVVRSFGEAAARAHAARFDLVEIHAGHGYLITNFLSPHTNKRTDEYGGGAENRRRILLEIVDSVRARVPREFPLSVRLSVTDYEPDGITIEETVELCRLLEEHGVDVVHASGGHHALQHYEASSWFMPRQLHRWGWEKIKPAVSIPVIASGSLVSPEVADEIIASGSADLVSVGRALLADPQWPEKARTGRHLEIVPCIRCNDGCLVRGLEAKRSVGCTVNPTVVEEGRFPIGTAPAAKRVAVAGGGPAGLRAAAILHDRGHRVVLFEPRELGGDLNHAVGSTFKVDIAELRRHLVHEVERRGIEVRKAAADAAALADGFDEVVLATGAPKRPFPGPVSGTALVIGPNDVTAHADTLAGRSVAVVGGGFQGVETAMRVAELEGTSVTVLERGDSLIRGDEVHYDAEELPKLLVKAGATVKLGHEATAIEDKGVRVRSDGIESLVEADAVIVALGREPSRSTLQTELDAAGIPARTIGSADRPGRVFDAIHAAFWTARLI